MFFFVIRVSKTTVSKLLMSKTDQVIRGLDQGILGGEGVPPMRVGKYCIFLSSMSFIRLKTYWVRFYLQAESVNFRFHLS